MFFFVCVFVGVTDTGTGWFSGWTAKSVTVREVAERPVAEVRESTGPVCEGWSCCGSWSDHRDNHGCWSLSWMSGVEGLSWMSEKLQGLSVGLEQPQSLSHHHLIQKPLPLNSIELFMGLHLACCSVSLEFLGWQHTSSKYFTSFSAIVQGWSLKTLELPTV